MRNLQLVWTRHQCDDDKSYFVSLELRDYDKNYIAQIPINKDFITNLIAKMATLEEKGYTYESPNALKYMAEGIP